MTQKTNAWHRLPPRWVVIGLVLLAVCVAANWSYQYRSLSPKQSVNNSPPDAMTIQVDEFDYRLAGWPAKFHVSLQHQTGPMTTCWSWRNLLIDFAIWLGVFILFGGSVWLSHRKQKKQKALGGKQLRLIDLLIVTCLFAGLLGYWRMIESQSQAEGIIAKSIEQMGGSVTRQPILPAWLVGRIPDSLHLGFTRITGASLKTPKAELLRDVVRLPNLRMLRLEDGGYDLGELKTLARNPLLTNLRISGRKLNSDAITAISSMHQLESLNLMRTNVNAKAISQFRSLPNLVHLNLIHTDVKLSDLKSDGQWASSLRDLLLPHPEEGTADRLQLSDLPNLEVLTCYEYDELPNETPVLLNISKCPRLKWIRLDALQRFDLDLGELPALTSIEALATQWTNRVDSEYRVASNPWIRNLRINSVPKIDKLTVHAAGMGKMEIESPELKQLIVSTDCRRLQSGNSRVAFEKLTAKQVNPKDVQQWFDTIAESNVETIDLSHFPFDGINLTQFAKGERIKRLNLSNAHITNKQLAQLAGMKSLEDLNLSQVPVDGLFLASFVTQFPCLKRLKVDSRHLGRLQLKELSQLESVFGENTEPYFPMQALLLRDMPKLQDHIALGAGIIFLRLDNLPSLRGLVLHDTLPPKTTLKGFRDLRQFAAGGEQVTEELMEEVLNCKELEKLTLAYCKIPPRLLDKIRELRQLKFLALPGAAVDDSIVKGWSELTELRGIVLDDTKVSNEGLRLLPLKQFTRLSIERTSADISIINELGGEDSPIKSLHLSGAISSQDMNTIGSFSKLQSLQFSDCQFDPKAIQTLASVISTNIKWIRIRQANLLGPDVRALISASQACFDLNDTNIEPGIIEKLQFERRSLWREDIGEFGRPLDLAFLVDGEEISAVPFPFDPNAYQYNFPKGEIDYEKFRSQPSAP